jgi:membrane-associated phospholipid phosphatase
MFNWFNRGRAFYYICFLSAVPYLTIITKLMYHEPRPFMVDDKIKVFGCTDEYGNPSGHAFFTAGGHFFVFLDIFHSDKEKKFSLLVYSISVFLTLSLSFLVGFARFYLGLHTINQIVYGWSLGIFVAFYFHFCLRETII